MKNILTTIALTIAIPAVAQAQAAPAPAAKMDCCEKLRAAGKDCMAGMDHSKMDHSKMGQGAQTAPQAQPTTPHQH